MTDHASPARAAAVSLLQTLYGKPDGTPLPVLIDRAARHRNLDSRDTALVTELTCGVLRAEKRLWAAVRPFLRNPGALPAPLRLLLLAASYELLFLDHIPGRATVHQAVGLARHRYGPALGGLTNAVLRAVNRDRDRIRAEDAAFLARDPHEATVDDVERLGSLPPGLASQWLRDYGPAAAWDFARRASRRPAPVCRLNAARPDAPDTLRALLDAGGQAIGRWGMRFPQPGAELFPLLERLERDGRITRQGEGSLLLTQRLIEAIRAGGYPEDSPLWDACCGRGGKSCALLEQGIHVAVASDPVQARLADLNRAITRLRLPRPQLACSPAQPLASSFTGHFPLILLDVPCSGTGTLARNPELRLRLASEARAGLPALQAELLGAAWNALAPGGLLAYATCALQRAENEDQIASFLATHPDADVQDQHLMLPGGAGQDILFLALLRKS
ncbi:MAG: hypothetical protein J1E80_02450 [Desulfovibrionaceae bacterium]|nr:hypothetical protein [Desulfovibrionaceae bacterium]